MTCHALLIWAICIAGGAVAIGYLLGEARQAAKIARAQADARANEISARQWRERYEALLNRYGRLDVAIRQFQEEVAPVLRGDE